MTDESPQSAGGKARAESLSSNKRSEIARKAAAARWSIPQATHEGTFNIGDATFSAAVLADGKRVLSQKGFLRAIGRSANAPGGAGEGIPPFLQAQVLKPFITQDILAASAPIAFVTTRGTTANGYSADLLHMICDLYLRYRDDLHAQGKTMPRNYAHVFRQCDLLMRGLARVGIAALVDEATGYQEVRDRNALQAILDKYLLKEYSAWAKRFPDNFYKEIFRLRNWTWRGMHVNRPSCVAKYTDNLVYGRLAPGILSELRKRNPADDFGRRKAKHHQWLTEDLGEPALAKHIDGVLFLMRAARSWEELMAMADRSIPKQGQIGQTLLFPESEHAAFDS